MRKNLICSFMTLVLLLNSNLLSKKVNALDNKDILDNYEVIVKYKPAVGKSGEVNSKKPKIKRYKASTKIEYNNILKELNKDNTIELIQQNIKYKKADIENKNYKLSNINVNDSYVNYQWHMNDLNIDKAWDFNTGSTVTVAILDTGIDFTHEDLKDKVVGGIDFTNTNSYMDTEGHGTHIAGTVAALKNNSKGVVGIAPDTKLLAVKVLDENGEGDTLTLSEGIIWAADQGAKVINLSLGSPNNDPVLKSAIDYANAKGSILVAAAGNEGTKGINYPAAYNNVLSVGAVNEANELASFSNFGDKVDIAAPGVNILSTVPSSQGLYAYESGTSMSTAVTSGQIALLAGKNPSMTYSTLKANLKSYTYSSSKPMESFYGEGIIDITKTLGGQATTLNPIITSSTDDNIYLNALKVENSAQLAGNLTLPYDVSWYKVAFNDKNEAKVKFNSTKASDLKAEIFDANMRLLTTLDNNYFTGKEYTLSKYGSEYYYIKVYDDLQPANSWNVNFTFNKIEEKLPTIKYQTHIQNIGWQDLSSNGEMAGTLGKSLRMEAVKINIENPLPNMKIKYQAHIQNI